MKSGNAKRIFSRAYDMPVSESEARQEVLSLARKAKRMGLDDQGEMLMVQLEVAYGVSIAALAKTAYETWDCES